MGGYDSSLAMKELKDTVIICNPRAGGGQAKKRWEKFYAQLQEKGITVNFSFTLYPGHAIKLAKEALLSGYRRIAVFGGDGTFNEVIQGVIRDDELVNPDLVLTFLCAGSSCDFDKLFKIKKSLIERLLSNDVIKIDLCRVRCRGFKGENVVRYFVVNSSTGVISHAIAEFNRSTRFINFLKKISVDLGAIVSGIRALASFGTFNGTLSFDNNESEWSLKNATVFKSSYFGGGMNYGLSSKADDGVLHVATIDAVNSVRLFLLIPSLYTGRILKKKPAKYHKCKSFKIDSRQDIFVETDGEIIGYLPAEYNILPRKLPISL